MSDDYRVRNVVSGGLPGITDRPAELVSLGKMKKGSPKTENRPGKELPYFRPVFSDAWEAAENKFMEVYGDEPKEVNVLFPFRAAAEFWAVQAECWKGSQLICAASINPDFDNLLVYWKTKRDPETKEYLIKNWKNLSTGESELFDISANEGKGPVIYTYLKGKKEVETPVYAVAQGRLRVLVMELMEFLGTITFETTSIVDIATITSRLAAIQIWADGFNGGSMTGIPCTVKRVEGTKPVPGGGRSASWFIELEPEERIKAAIGNFMLDAVYAKLSLPLPSAAGQLIEGNVVEDVLHIEQVSGEFVNLKEAWELKVVDVLDITEMGNMLNRSVLGPDAAAEDLARWIDVYVGHREKDKKRDEAAKLTNSAYQRKAPKA